MTGSVTFLLPNTTTTRFIQHDSPAFVAAMKELAPGVTVDVQNAEGKSDQQLTQAESAINAGAKALVLVAADPSLSGAVLQKAAEANIPVIGYEHEALDGPLYAQVIFDPKKVGEAQGQYFADNLPAGKDGVVTISRVYGNNGDNYTIQDQAGQNEKIQSLIRKGIEEGATLVAGGTGRPDGLDTGHYVKPTVFADVTPDMTIAREEIFGPVLVILGYDDLDHAIEIANDTDYGLAGYVSGEDLDTATSVAGRIRAGWVAINGGFDFRSAFGGYKQSGNGREWGDIGFHEYLETKSIMIPAAAQ